ncbi:MAG: TonB-dependent receptor [Kiritimatiellae bacterium]|nr:TonB-dependent receptor [Kiritimatiellia bacterium]
MKSSSSASFRRVSIIVVPLLLISSVCTYAETNGDLAAGVALPEVIVHASRYAAVEYPPPANIEVLDRERLDQLAGDWLTVLNSFRGLYMSPLTGSPIQMEPSLRGFGDYAQGRILLLYSGIRLNRPDMALFDWLSIPLDEVSAIELDRGGASAMYGNYAVAGVLQIRTEPAEVPYVRMEAGSDGFFSGAAGAGLHENAHRASVRVQEDDGDGYRDSSDYHASTLSGDYLYESNGLRVAANALAQDLFYQLPGSLTKAEMDANRRAAENENDSINNRQYRGSISGSATSAVQSILFDAGWTRRLIDSTMNSFSSYNAVVLDGTSLSPRWRWHADERWDVLLGADVYYDKLDQTRYPTAEFAGREGDAKVTRLTYAGYASGGVRLPIDLRLDLAGRLEQAETEAKSRAGGETTTDDRETQNGQAWSASLSRAWPLVSVYAGLHRIYRYPFIDEMASYYGWGDTLYKDIDPEHGINLDAGASLMLPMQMELSLECYQLDMKDEIAYNPVTYRNENMDETRRRGMGLGLQRPTGVFQWHTSVDWVDASFTGGPYDGNKVPLVSEYVLKAGFSWQVLDQVSTGLEGRWIGARKVGGDYENTQENLEAYTTVDWMIRWEPLETVAIFGAVCNLFNEQYASSAYLGYPEVGYYPAAGTTWKVGAKVTF